jgi:hypothetical protein
LNLSPPALPCLCPGQESNLHDQKRSLGPQPSASTTSATWAYRCLLQTKNLWHFNLHSPSDIGWRKPPSGWLLPEIVHRTISLRSALPPGHIYTYCKLRTYGIYCAQNRTRTCTYLRTLVPETSASTNSAIWAFDEQSYLELPGLSLFAHPKPDGGIGPRSGWPLLKLVHRTNFLQSGPIWAFDEQSYLELPGLSLFAHPKPDGGIGPRSGWPLLKLVHRTNFLQSGPIWANHQSIILRTSCRNHLLITSPEGVASGAANILIFWIQMASRGRFIRVPSSRSPCSLSGAFRHRRLSAGSSGFRGKASRPACRRISSPRSRNQRKQ